jgi:hypothetical protein
MDVPNLLHCPESLPTFPNQPIGGFLCRAIPAGHLIWAELKSDDTVFCCPAGAGRCPTNAFNQHPIRPASREPLGPPNPNHPEDIADLLEQEAAEKFDDKVRQLFAGLLQLPNPSTAPWDAINSASQEEWATALNLPGASWDEIQDEQRRLMLAIEE